MFGLEFIIKEDPTMSTAEEGEEIVKMGTLEKLGGGEGGRQNWKKRFFVYKTKTLEYYESESVSVWPCGTVWGV